DRAAAEIHDARREPGTRHPARASTAERRLTLHCPTIENDPFMKTRADAIALDRDDPLAHLRDRFALTPDVIYLDGNSLGVPPVAAAARAQEVISREWTEGLIRSWNAAGWFALPRRLG